MPLTKIIVDKCNIFRDHLVKREFRSSIFQLNDLCSRLYEPKTMLENIRALVSHFTKPKLFLKLPCLRKLTDKSLLQSAELYLTFGLPCASPKATLKQLNITTMLRRTQKLPENAVPLISKRVHSTHSVSTKQVRTIYTSIGNPKDTLENNWTLTSYNIKANRLQKPLWFLLLWNKLNVCHTALKKPKSKFRTK